MSHLIPAFSSVIVPVVVLEKADDALPMAQALLEGGIDVIEVTLRRPTGLPGIEKIARQLPDICVGAGTLLSADDVKRAIDAGASFGLSPGSSPTLVDAVLKQGQPFISGVATPSAHSKKPRVVRGSERLTTRLSELAGLVLAETESVYIKFGEVLYGSFNQYKSIV